MEKYRKQLYIVLAITILLLGSGFFVYFFFSRTFKVTFLIEDNIFYKELSAKYGEQVLIPEDPKRENKLFLGWYYNGKKFDFNQKIKKDYRLVAKWKDGITDFVKITFFDGEEGKTVLVDRGGKIQKIDDPVKEGYRFLGWFLEDNTLFDFSSSIEIDQKLFAHWEKIPFKNESIKPSTRPSSTPSVPPVVPEKREVYKYSVELINRDKTSIERILKIYKNEIDITSEVKEIRSNDKILGVYSEKLQGIRIVYQQFLKYSEYQILLNDGTVKKIIEK